MGCYDEVRIDGREGQVKCFASVFDDLSVDSQVGQLNGHFTYSIAMREGGYVNVTAGKIASWTDAPAHDVIFDKWGTQRQDEVQEYVFQATTEQ